jgi:hypothetical protein
MHEIFPVPQPLRFMPEHLSQFVQLSESGVQIDRNSRGERILLPQGVSAWECIDPNDPSDPYSDQVRSQRKRSVAIAHCTAFFFETVSAQIFCSCRFGLQLMSSSAQARNCVLLYLDGNPLSYAIISLSMLC